MADRHPTPGQLYAARRSPHGTEAEGHLAHAAACALCSAELARQEAFDNPEPVSQAGIDAAWERFAGQADAAAVSRRPVPSRWRPALALAATLAACVVGLAFLWPPRPSTLPVSNDAGPTRGGSEAAGVWSPTGVVEAPPAELVFPVSDGELRRVTVYDDAGTYRWTSEPAAGGRIPFPVAERLLLRPGVKYFWTILDGDEATAAQSFAVWPRTAEKRGPA